MINPSLPAFLTTLGLSSAVAIGANWVEVRQGRMTPAHALRNGLAKGAAATLVLRATTRGTVWQVAMAAGLLAGAGFLIDSAMNTPPPRTSGETAIGT